MKKRNRKLTHPRKDRLIREWEEGDWCYCLWQQPSGTFVITGSDGENWCQESGATVKAALAHARATPAQVDALLQVEE